MFLMKNLFCLSKGFAHGYTGISEENNRYFLSYTDMKIWIGISYSIKKLRLILKK